MSKHFSKLFSVTLVLALMMSMLSVVGTAEAAKEFFANPSTPVFINEIHYDNSGTDTGEAIEIAGPAGTDLTGWSIVRYNGSNGTLYGMESLSGTISDLGGGYGVFVVFYSSNGLQNGSPDGIALVDPSSVLVQFLSYEGDFTAQGGPADGMLSTDIGVSEDSGTLIGDSLQLMGSGTTYGDFTWAPASANTFGAPNTGQTFGGGGGTPDVSINEIRIDQPSTDNDEYFELAGAPGTSLDGLTYLVIGDGTGGSGVIENVTDLGGQVIGGSGFFVAAESTFTFGAADLTTSLNFENSDNVTHLLVAGFSGSSGDDLDTNDDGVLDVTPWSEVLDLVALVEEENPPSSTEFHYGPPSVGPDGSFVPGHAFFCSGAWLIGGFSGGDDTPGAINNCPPPTVTINEIRIDQPSDDDDEYFELAADPGASLDGLTYLVVGDGTGGSGVIEAVVNLSGNSVPASGYFVAAESTFTLGTADLITSLNFENSDNVTHLLVRDFSGANGDDLDTDDDGVLDVTPWSELADLIALVEEENPPSGTEYHYGPPSVGPDGSFVPGHVYLCDDGWRIGAFGGGEDTPGAENGCAPIVQEVKIHDVQGSGASSPLVGQTVIVEGIVVGDFQDGASGVSGDLNGFFVQEEGADADADALTSEGIFVFDGSSPSVNVAVGDLVRVEGAVSEFNGLTEITSFSGVSIISSNNTLPAVSSLSLPVTAVDDFEAYESMYVTFPQDLVISEYFNFDRFNEIVLTSERHLTPTAEFEPGPDAIAAANAFLLDKITLDDGRTNQNPDPAIHPNGSEFNLGNLFRGGDTVANVTGIMHYAFDLYRIQPTQGADYTNTNVRTASPDPVGGNLTVASFNVLNYFTTLDDSSCPYSGGCRGADANQPLEFTRQRDKIIAALAEIDADVVGLLEIENHPGDVSTADLVSGLNDVLGAGTYAYVSTGAIGTDSIKVALIYKPASVDLIGGYALLDTSVDPRFIDTKNRPTLAQTFMNSSTGGVFTVAVNHLKSKGSDCNDVGDPDTGDGAGNCNLTRKAAAEAMVDWLAGDPTGSGDDDFLIIGDLNSYDKEEPIDVLVAGGYTDMIYAYHGEDAYSYVFDGQTGYLDYALASTDLIGEATGVSEWHINADEPDLIDYDTSFKGPNQDAIYNADPYRSSDHDPVIVGLELTTAAEIHELIDDVQKLVDDGVLNDGQGNALITKLEHALEKLADGKSDVAANQLGAFINQVEDFVDEGVLTSEQGDLLIKAASLLVGVLGG